jgi:hypothetical protein
MGEPRKTKQQGKLDEEFASTSNDDRHPETADDRNDRAPSPQGGKGTPSQAEGERKPDA